MKSRASKLCMLLPAMALVTATAFAQNRTIKGTVNDALGGIAGANVSVKGTTIGVITDANGNFTLQVPQSAKTLDISFIGFEKQTITIPANGDITVVLKEAAEMLDEVVAIGYGTAKKGNLTGSVAKINAEKLGDRPITDVTSALQGQMAGVEIRSTSGQPGQDIQIRVRGAASIHADSNPLYVVDGIATDNLNSINPNDIESIEVLKDASSSAIYGSRGANGVVLVTTKKGKSGKAKVELQTTWGWQQMERKIDLVSAEEWIWMKKYAINRSYVQKFGSKGATADDTWEQRLAQNGGTFSNGYMYDPRWDNGGKGLSAAEAAKYSAYTSSDLTQDLQYVDWQDEFFRTAPQQQYQLSVSGGVDKTAYRVSAGWLDQEGIAVATSFKRLTLRANVDSEVNKYFKFGLSIAPTMSWQKLGGGVDNKDSETHHTLAMVPVVESSAGIYSGANPYPIYTWANSTISPVAKMEGIDNNKDIFRMLSSAYMKFDLTHGFNATVNGAWTLYDYQQRNFISSDVANAKWSSTAEGVNSSNTRSEGRYNKFSIEALLNYQKEIGKHNIQAMLGWGDEERRGWTTTVKATGFPNNALQTFTTSTATTINTATADIATTTRLVSFFGRAQYDYDSRYLLTASLRRDGSSLFGANAKWGWFPAVSAAWRVSNEAFWDEESWFNNLKLRASWGENGNNSIPATAALSTLAVSNYSWSGASASGYSASASANPDLGWEKTKSWNVAVDFGFLENRFNLSLDYYMKTTTDLLYQVQVPSVLGYTTAWDNIGEIQNKGLEIEINTTNIDRGDLRWSTTLNMGWNSNEVKSLAEGQDVFTGAWQTQILREGEPLKSFFLYKTVGVFDKEKFEAKNADGTYVYPRLSNQAIGDYIFEDYDGNGKIDSDDRQVCGSAAPKMTWGFTNTFKYKDFDLSILMTGQTGGKIYGLLGRAIDRTGMGPAGNVMQRWSNAWYNDAYQDTNMKAQYAARGGWDGKTPALVEGTNSTTYYTTDWLYDSDFIKIKNITLGYNCPQAKKLGIQNLRIYGSIENVYSWDSYDYFSVESSNGSTMSSNGISGDYDYGSYPSARVYSIGLNVTF